MSGYSLISSILKGEWFIQEDFALSQALLIARMLKGVPVDFGTSPQSQVLDEDNQLRPSEGKSTRLYAATGGHFVRQFKGGEDLVAVHTMHGPVMKNDGPCGEWGSATVLAEMKAADAMPSVIAHVFHGDTPGGQVAGCFQFYEGMKALQKPVFTYAGDLLCSAGILMSIGSERIYASHKTSTIGSIGVMATIINLQKHLEKEGIELIELYAEGSENKNRRYREALKGNTEPYVTEVLTPLRNEFVNVVKAERPDIDTKALTGEDVFAEEAISWGLIDGIATKEQVMSLAYEEGKRQQSRKMKRA